MGELFGRIMDRFGYQMSHWVGWFLVNVLGVIHRCENISNESMRSSGSQSRSPVMKLMSRSISLSSSSLVASVSRVRSVGTGTVSLHTPAKESAFRSVTRSETCKFNYSPGGKN